MLKFTNYCTASVGIYGILITYLYIFCRYFKCLDKKPSAGEANEKTKFVEMTGEMFTKSEQCRHRLGKQASACYVS